MAKKVSLPCLSFQMGWSKQNGNLNWGKNDLFWVNKIHKGHIIRVVDAEIFTKRASIFLTNTHNLPESLMFFSEKNVIFNKKMLVSKQFCGGRKIMITDLLQLLWMNKTNVTMLPMLRLFCSAREFSFFFNRKCAKFLFYVFVSLEF